MAATAFLLAAGLGTRLRPLTLHRPKPLLPVCGVPVIDQSLALCARHGLREVVVNAHHLHEQVSAWARAREADGFRIHVQVELPDILGTGGGLRRALPLLDDPFVVLNGDVLCDADLPALLADCGDAAASLLLRRSPDAARFGVVAVDGDDRVVRLASVAADPGTEPVATDTHFTGIHAMTRAAVERVPAEGFACVVRTAYRSLVPERRVRGRLHVGDWFDIGDPRSYLQANLDALHGRLALPLDPWTRAVSPAEATRGTGVRLVPPVWIGAGVVLGDGCEVGPDVVLGDGVQVGPGCALEGTVAWDGVRIEAGSRLREAVIHDGGVLSIPA